MIKLQETPESIPEGETPHTIQMFAFDELCEISRPGDKVEVTGIFRAIPLKVNPRLSSLRSVYKTYIDILHISKSRKDRPGQVRAEDASAKEDSEWATKFDESTETSVVSSVRKERIEKMGRDPHIYENLSASLAPSVWEMDGEERITLSVSDLTRFFLLVVSVVVRSTCFFVVIREQAKRKFLIYSQDTRVELQRVRELTTGSNSVHQ